MGIHLNNTKSFKYKVDLLNLRFVIWTHKALMRRHYFEQQDGQPLSSLVNCSRQTLHEASQYIKPLRRDQFDHVVYYWTANTNMNGRQPLELPLTAIPVPLTQKRKAASETFVLELDPPVKKQKVEPKDNLLSLLQVQQEISANLALRIGTLENKIFTLQMQLVESREKSAIHEQHILKLQQDLVKQQEEIKKVFKEQMNVFRFDVQKCQSLFVNTTDSIMVLTHRMGMAKKQFLEAHKPEGTGQVLNKLKNAGASYMETIYKTPLPEEVPPPPPEIKEGSFNPYGNEQTTGSYAFSFNYDPAYPIMYNSFHPEYTTFRELWFFYCQRVATRICHRTKSDLLYCNAIMDECLSQINWEPQWSAKYYTIVAKHYVQKTRRKHITSYDYEDTLDLLTTANPWSKREVFWKTAGDLAITNSEFNEKLFNGSFNPYGNGQFMIILSFFRDLMFLLGVVVSWILPYAIPASASFVRGFIWFYIVSAILAQLPMPVVMIVLFIQLKTGSFNPYGNGQTDYSSYDEEFLMQKGDRHGKEGRRSRSSALDRAGFEWDALIHKHRNYTFGHNVPEVLNNFTELLISANYASSKSSDLPLVLRQLALELYIKGYGLPQCDCLMRTWNKFGNCKDVAYKFMDRKEPAPGAELRKYVVSLYRRFAKQVDTRDPHGKLHDHLFSRDRMTVPKDNRVWNAQMLNILRGTVKDLSEDSSVKAHLKQMVSEAIVDAKKDIQCTSLALMNEAEMRFNRNTENVMSNVQGLIDKNRQIMIDTVVDLKNDITSNASLQRIGKQVAIGAQSSFSEMLETIRGHVTKTITDLFGTIVSWLRTNAIFLILVAVLMAIIGGLTSSILWRLMCKDVPEPVYQAQSLSDNIVVQWAHTVYEAIFMTKFEKPLEHLNKFVISVKNLTEFAKTSASVFKSLVDWISETATGIPFFTDTKIAQEIVKSHTTFMKYNTNEGSHEVARNIDAAREVVAAYDKLRDNYASIARVITDPGQRQILQQTLIRGEPLYQTAMLCLNEKVRQIPVVVHAVGPTKQGKSAFMDLLASKVYWLCTGKKLMNNDKFERKQNDQYFSGYHNQFLTTIDDMFQKTDTEVRADQALEFIYMVGPTAYQLNMPDLGSKGKTFFSSEMIATSSNVTDPNLYSAAIKEKSAFLRRFHYWLEIRLKPGVKHCVGLPSKKDRNNWDITQVHWDFTQPDWTIQKPIQQKWTFDALADSVANRIKAEKHSCQEYDIDWTEEDKDEVVNPYSDIFLYRPPQVDPAKVVPVYTNVTTVRKSDLGFDDEETSVTVYPDEPELNPVYQAQGLFDDMVRPVRDWWQGTWDKDHQLTPGVKDNLQEFWNAHPEVHPNHAYACKCDGCLYAKHLKHPGDCTCDTCALHHLGCQCTRCSNLGLRYKGAKVVKDVVAYPFEWIQVSMAMAAMALAASAMIGIIITAVCSAVRWVLSMLGFKFDDEWMAESTDKYQEKQRRRVFKNKRVPEKQPFKAQFQDDNAMNVSLKILTKNQSWCRFVGKNGTHVSNWMLWLEGRVCVVPLHTFRAHGGLKEIFENFNPDDPSSCIHHNCWDLLYEDVTRDEAYLFMPYAPIMPSLYRYMHKEFIRDPVDHPARLSIMGNAEFIIQGVTLIPCSSTSSQVDKDPPQERKNIYIAKDLQGAGGECGAAVMLFNPRFEKKLVGIHIAGHGKDSLVAPVYTTDVERCREILKQKYPDCWRQYNMVEADLDDGLTEEEQQTYAENFADLIFQSEMGFFAKGVRVVGRLQNGFVQPGKTKLRPTIMNTGVQWGDQWLAPPYPVNEAPAKLRPFEIKDDEGIHKVDPNILSFRKLAGKTVSAPPRFVFDDRCWKGVLRGDITKYRVLTLDEVVWGAAWCGLPGLDLTTSTGFPLCRTGMKRNKIFIRILATADKPEERKIAPWFRARVARLIAMCKMGRVPRHFVLATLKDELRGLDRVAKGYTRLFTNGELVMLCALRMYLGVLMMIDEHDRYGDIQVGVNTYSSSWKVLYEKLMRFGDHDNAKDQDVEGYDLHYHHWWADGFVKWFCKRTGKSMDCDDCIVIFGLMRATFCVYIVNGKIVMWSVQMPSGSLVTSYGNTFANSVKHRCIWYNVCEDNGIQVDYDDANEGDFFGDDAVETTHPDYMKYYNGLQVAAYAKKLFDHTHTDSTKGELVVGKRLREVNFLQRRWEERDGLLYCPLNETSLQSMVQWVMESPNMRNEELFKVKCHTACREWFLHGREKFEHHKAIINKFLNTQGGYQMFTESYDDLFNIYLRQYNS